MDGVFRQCFSFVSQALIKPQSTGSGGCSMQHVKAAAAAGVTQHKVSAVAT
jgi:hypothetical protein